MIFWGFAAYFWRNTAARYLFLAKYGSGFGYLLSRTVRRFSAPVNGLREYAFAIVSFMHRRIAMGE